NRRIKDQSSYFRIEETRARVPEHRIRSESAIAWHVDSNRKSIDLRFVPLDRNGQRRVEQHVEVEIFVRVLPEIFAVNHQVLTDGLFKARSEVVARSRGWRLVGESCKHVLRKAARSGRTRENKELVEGCNRFARIPCSQD